MHPIPVDGPAVEPVVLSEMKEHLRVHDAAEGELIGGLIKAARLTAEAASRRLLIEQRWHVMLPLSPPIAPFRRPRPERLLALVMAGTSPA